MQKEFYLSAQAAALAAQTSARRRSRQLAAARGIAFVLAVLALAGGYDGSAGLAAIGAALIFVFARLVATHRRTARQLALLSARLMAAEGVLARTDDRWRSLAEDGAKRQEGAPPQFADLHVFGPSSLYQYLCRAGAPSRAPCSPPSRSARARRRSRARCRSSCPARSSPPRSS